MHSLSGAAETVNTQNRKNTRLLSFDFGLRRIGAATGNTITGTTQALSTISARGGIPDWNEMTELIQQWKPGAFVVGLPLEMDGSEGTMCREVQKFGAALGEKYGLTVHYVDERLTSVDADNLIRQPVSPGKRPGKKRIAAKDNLAAELILQTYLKEN